MSELPIISIKEARKLLGKEAQGLDDDEILEIIVVLSAAAKSYLKKKSVRNANINLKLQL